VLARLAGLEHERRRLINEVRLVPSPMHDLVRRFAVDETGLVVLMLCLAPEVELSYQTVYAYLNDDIARRVPTVDLCRRLAGAPLRDDAGVVADERRFRHDIGRCHEWPSRWRGFGHHGSNLGP